MTTASIVATVADPRWIAATRVVILTVAAMLVVVIVMLARITGQLRAREPTTPQPARCRTARPASRPAPDVTDIALLPPDHPGPAANPPAASS